MFDKIKKKIAINWIKKHIEDDELFEKIIDTAHSEFYEDNAYTIFYWYMSKMIKNDNVIQSLILTRHDIDCLLSNAEDVINNSLKLKNEKKALWCYQKNKLIDLYQKIIRVLEEINYDRNFFIEEMNRIKHILKNIQSSDFENKKKKNFDRFDSIDL